MSGTIFNIHNLSPYLGALGLLGTITLLTITGMVLWQYRVSPVNSFQWRMRNWRLKQITAVACLFFLAMSASYWVIQEPLGWIYLLVAAKCGTGWFRRAISRGT
ncbi:MAG TPA: hypothetical protein VJO32_14115 [Ktedonobacteraceae bacterium]|nr:hypothetical protein [Ktedonobacteraceae bacterium]